MLFSIKPIQLDTAGYYFFIGQQNSFQELKSILEQNNNRTKENKKQFKTIL